jgi:hypothetical protein
MHSLGNVKLLASFLRPRTVHWHGLATAGAIVTCVAVVLNVGSLGKAPKIDALPDSAFRETARAITDQPPGSTSMPRPETDAATQPDRPQLVIEAADVSEPIRPSIEPASVSVVEVAPSVSQPGTRKDAADEIQAKPLQDLSAAVPAAPAPGDHTNPHLVKRATIVGVWAPDAGTCSARNFREGLLPTVISGEGAWAGETFCIFKNKEQTETGWRVVAKCSNQRERWTSNVRLTVNDNRLTWASKRGTQIYTRCAPDVLMAAR